MALGLGTSLGSMRRRPLYFDPPVFADGTTLLHLPIAANAGSPQSWGTDVRKVLTAAEASQDSTTVCNLGTGGTVTRTCDPYTTTAVDLTQANFGWCITPTDMGAVPGRRRKIPAGNHVLIGNVTISTAFTAETRQILMFSYKVSSASAGRTRTLLGSTTTNLPLTSGDVNVTLALAEQIFEADETIQYSFEMNAGGLAVSGRTVAFNTGFSTNSRRIAIPAMESLP